MKRFLDNSTCIVAGCRLQGIRSNYRYTRARQGLFYPQTATIDQNDDYFGTNISDPYRWLENEGDSAVRNWITAENDVTFGYLDQIPTVTSWNNGSQNWPTIRKCPPRSMWANIISMPKMTGCKTSM